MPKRLRSSAPLLRQRWLVTRQGALASAARLYPRTALAPSRQFAFTVLGSMLIGLAVALVIHARLGLPPYDVLISGVRQHLPITHGQSAWLVGGVLLAAAWVLGQRPTPLTLFLVISNGITVDAASSLMVDAEPLGVRLAMVGLGMGLLALGIAFVVRGGLTGGAFDLLMRAAEARDVSPTRVRTGLELGALALGIGLGGSIGFATIVFALGIGPLLGVVLQAFADHHSGRSGRLAEVGS